MGEIVSITINSPASSKREPDCTHDRMYINELARVVTCEQCAEEIDPDEVMSRLMVRLAEIGYQIHVLRGF